MKVKSWDVQVKDNPNAMIATETDDFFTTDTEAFLVFNIKDEEFMPYEALITLVNKTDETIVSETIPVDDDGVITYEMRPDIIKHSGEWHAQLVYTQDKEELPEKYTSKVVSFNVSGHLMDDKVPALIAIENWDSFIANAGELFEEWESSEATRQENEITRIANEEARQAEILEKIKEVETSYGSRLSALESNREMMRLGDLAWDSLIEVKRG